MVWHGMLCYCMVCYVMLWYVMLWHGMVWHGKNGTAHNTSVIAVIGTDLGIMRTSVIWLKLEFILIGVDYMVCSMWLYCIHYIIV